MRHCMNRRGRRHGFTLLELLVVVAIFVGLFAMIMPAVTSVRQKARAVNCASNLRQLHMASLTYATDNGKWMPLTISWRDPNDPVDERIHRGWLHWYPHDDETRDEYFYIGVLAQTNIVTGTLWPYIEELKLYACPSHVIDNPQAVRSYAMYNPNASDSDERHCWWILCASQSFEPVETVMFAEVKQSRLSDIQSGGQFWSISHVEFRHSGDTANIVFFDGHAERGTQSEFAQYF